jgi:hypothetical protein
LSQGIIGDTTLMPNITQAAKAIGISKNTTDSKSPKHNLKTINNL